jgi:hypothetical protein
VRFVQGQTYWIVVSACCRRGQRGGELLLTMYGGGTARVTSTLDSVESGGVSGRLFLNGTVSCATPSVVFLSAEASQRVGEAVARGFGEVAVENCTQQSSPWRLRVDSDTGWAFRPGTVSIDLFSAGVDGFTVARDEQAFTATVTDDPGSRTVPRPRAGKD